MIGDSGAECEAQRRTLIDSGKAEESDFSYSGFLSALNREPTP
jgi:hypothetical protein